MTASSARALAAQEGELVDEVRGRVGRADPVVHPDLQVVAPLRRAVDADVKNVDPRLPPDQRLPDLLLDQATHGHRVGANTRSWIPHPKSGRICRSPGAVLRISWMLCRIFSS